jgi:hypothetical protein
LAILTHSAARRHPPSREHVRVLYDPRRAIGNRTFRGKMAQMSRVAAVRAFAYTGNDDIGSQ